MKILMVNHEYPPVGGGAGVALKHLAESLASLGHEVRVLTMGSSLGVERENGVEVIRFCSSEAMWRKLAGLWNWISFLTKAPGVITEHVRSFRPNVIHSFFVFPGGYVVAKSGTDVPHVTTVIGADIYDPTRSVSAHRNWLVRQGVKKALAHASAVTSDSRDMADRTRELFPNQEVTPIPLGVPSLCPDGRTRSELDLPEDAFVVVSVARLVKRKRLDVLLEAVSRIHDPLVYTVIMGSGPAEEPLMALSEALGISERVRFSGWVSEADKSAYLANAELFCLPSEHEGFGLVFIESMSVGTPVITTGVGGQNDIIRDGTDGFFTKAGDAEDLREKMCLLIADRDLLEAMRTSVLQHSKTFLPARTAEQYLSIYSKYTPVTSS